ncbi:DUF417 family protein [Belliella aquatica]|uniref:Uncharacterized protein n=1 Tax=Belliella aquatica TaxID=1323734 RepID=A0ABQ1MSN8_9BACT|nr:DUF417 family protein [Belliella aquatica]MCH7406444.1 DUF417 family protein [Belliella aquatica]GGC46063.1 hypothetical protein GCM10010993_25820 [Belliella aquatica]
MIDHILKIEKIGKKLLRFGMVAYLLFIGTLNFNNTLISNNDWIQSTILFTIVLVTAVLLLMHFKKPKLGAIGGFLAALLFLITVIYLSYLEISSGIPISLVFLHVIKDIMLTFAAIILAGESLKEMIREKITKPFPVR